MGEMDVSGEVGSIETVQGAVEPIYMHLTLTDPDVVAEVSAYEAGPKRKEFVDLLLRVGVQSVRAARGMVDGETIRQSGEALLAQLQDRFDAFRENSTAQLAGQLAAYFDPQSGSFSERVRSLTESGGALESVVRGPLQQERERMQAVLESVIGPDGRLSRLLGGGENNEFLRSMREQMAGMLDARERQIVEQFSLDSEDSALSRLVRELKNGQGDLTEALGKRMSEVMGEFSLDKQDSALSRLVETIRTSQVAISKQFSLDESGSALNRLQEELLKVMRNGEAQQKAFQDQVLSMLAETKGRKAAEKASTTHGHEFEARVGEAVSALTQGSGDILEECGNTTGTIRASKVGDFVLTMSADSLAAGARIVVEAKQSGAYTLKTTLEECDEARRNRGADVCLFVHSKETAPDKLPTLSRYRNDIVIVWDATDETSDVVMKAGIELAKGLSVRRASNNGDEKASYDVIDRAIEVLRKQFEGLDELRTLAQTAENGAKKMSERVRIMSEQTGKAMENLVKELAKVRQAQGAQDLF